MMGISPSPGTRRISSPRISKDETCDKGLLDRYVSYKELDGYIEGLILPKDKEAFVSRGLTPKEPDLEQIMVYLERNKNNESFAL